jgi:hypothetical protein
VSPRSNIILILLTCAVVSSDASGQRVNIPNQTYATGHREAISPRRSPGTVKPKPSALPSVPAASAQAAQPPQTIVAATPLIGMWYTPWWDQSDQFGHWAGARASGRPMPAQANYSSGDTAVIRRQYEAMRGCGVNFIIMDDTNTLFVDNSIINHNIKAWFDFMDALPPGERLPICIAFGGELNQHSCVKCFHDAADYIWDTYAQRPSYFHMSGKPLALWYIENDVMPEWSDSRYTVRRCYHFFRTADQGTHEGWGWGANPFPPDNSECMSVFPGWVLGSNTPIERRGGDLYEEDWVRVLKAHPRYVAVADWNQWDEQTAIEDSTKRRDHYGDSCPDWYRQITEGYAYLRLHTLIHGFYYRDESEKAVYYCDKQ